jgi:phosphohistidine phosphatase
MAVTPHRRLTLLRHGHAAAADATTPDRDRPLTAQGEADATAMGQRFRAQGARPSLILVSPALRTLQTARLVAGALGYPLEFLQREPELYLASPEDILAVLGRQDDAFQDVLVCGHNPGLSELAASLSGQDQGSLPTCGALTLGVNGSSWSAARGLAEVLRGDHPRLAREQEPSP